MQQFYGSWVARFTMLLIGLCGLGSTYFFLYTPISRGMSRSSTGDSMLVATIPIGIGFLLEGLICLLGLVESFTVYTLDAEKIVKRAVYGTSEMAWKTITDIKTGGRQAIVTALIDDAGRRMRLVPMLMRDGNGLRAAIEEHLKGLREKLTQELGWQAKTYRPGRNLSYLLFALVAVLALCGFALLGNPRANNPPSLQLVGVLTFLVPVVVGALLALYLFTWTITIAPGAISSSGLFFRKTIPFHQIEAVMVRDIPVKNDPNTNRAQQSIGRREAESALHIAYWMLAVIFVLPPVAYFDLRQRLKKKQAVKGKS